ncbi:ATP-binding protein [Pyrofollis japonicus]|uniref:hypothetical protein n=1 Tax=Pyrofollis japonicus TaxID=3060460 RepID=UPI00295AE779|nr:hypothetical protein [Pyrofollis japonicus]
MEKRVIERPTLKRFLLKPGRRLLYGRRKTGKTFYTRYVLRDYEYFIVRRGGKIYSFADDMELDTRTFIKICKTVDKVILDEFHRANKLVFDAIHANECRENLVLITSTLHYYRQFVEATDAPLKGLFNTRQVGLVSPVDLLASSWDIDDPKKLVEILVFYQEPGMIGFDLEDIVFTGRELAPSLVGEVLDEEDYVRTKRYDAILEALAAGSSKPSEIANYLYARGLLEKPNPSLITKYLNIMTRTGLIERVEIWGKQRGSIYRHASPLTELIYYLDARYGFFDVPPEWGFVKKAVEQRIPLLVERFFERFLSELYGLKPVKILQPEIDIALAEFKRLRIVAEVKWSKRVTRQEVREAEAKLSSLKAEERFLIVPDESVVAAETWLKVIDVRKAVLLARRAHREAETLDEEA